MTSAEPLGDSETLTVRLPFRLRKRGGRKLMVVPEGATRYAPQPARIDNPIMKAIARAHRWRRMLEDGTYGTIAELAAAEKINQSYACRLLRVTLLAPEIVEAILDGRQRVGMDLAMLMKPFPVNWRRQYDALGLITRRSQVQIPFPRPKKCPAEPAA